MKTNYKSIILAIGLFLALSTLVSAAPGDLDPTFSGDGKLTDFIPGTASYGFVATAVQPDGKIVAVGGASNPQFFYVARYNSDGSPDTTFGGGTGKVSAQFGPFYNYPNDVAIQPDGKIVVAGCYCEEDLGDYTLALARLNTDGSLDLSFDGDGVLTRPDFVGPANSVAIQTDGKIVVAGQAGGFLDWLVLRFNSDGSQDFTFIISGNIFAPDHAAPYSVAVQTDGKIVAAGSSVYTAAPGDFAVVRYNPNGSLDTTFDGDGKAITPVVGWDQANSVAIQTDGKIVAAGASDRFSANNDFALIRYNPNGSLDKTFDGDGILTTPIGVGADGASSVKIQGDGKILVAGYSFNGSNNDFALVRYNPTGALDTTFGGGDGKTTVDFDVSNDNAYGMALDNVGRAVVGGGSDGRFAIARFLLVPRRTFADFDGDGKTDISVFRPSDRVWYLNQSTNGFYATQFGLSTDKITPVDYDGDGKTDIAVFRDGIWYRLNSSNNAFHAFQFGQAGDVPVPADYTGDGRAELAVYRGGMWFTLNLANNQFNAVQFGTSTDKPVLGDFDGDGKSDYAVYRDGIWYLLQSTQGFTDIQFGISTDKLVPVDYDGDGKTDVAVYRDGTWYLLGSQTGFTAFQFGNASDIPAPADYDGDGRTDAAVFRNGVWYLRQSTNGFSAQPFGLTNDKPVPAAFLPDYFERINLVADSSEISKTLTDEDFDKSSKIPKAALAAFVVNSANDGADVSIGDGVCETATVGECTLRAAIQEANFTVAPDTINFSIGTGGLQTINVGAGGLPQISQPVTIDGATQPGFTSAPIIELNGAAAGAGINGLRITAANSTVRSLVINRFTSDGIEINGEAADGNLISGCYLGTNASGTVDLGNNSAGVFITGGADNTIVGGATATPGTAPGNVISGNNNRGIYISLAATTNTAIHGNIIGLQANGTAGMGNGALGEGILIENSTGNRIGGSTADTRNIISGNASDGVDLFNTSGNLIQSNYIGTNINGTAALGNTSNGIIIRQAINNTVGGSTATPGTAPANLISGNGNGIVFFGGGGGNLVRGNIVGLNASGNADLGNSVVGVNVGSESNTTIGGATSDLRNIISGNNSHGLVINGSTNINVIGNYVGTDISGALDLGNNDNGLLIGNSSNITIGGSIAAPGTGLGNVISGNGNVGGVNPDGIEVAAGSSNIQIRGNIIGLDASGANDIGNAGQGIHFNANLATSAFGSTIGGATADLRNIISGNNNNGILLTEGNAAGSDNNTIAGNFIGTDVSGTLNKGNSLAGVRIDTADGILIGGAAAGAGNIIAFNATDGVYVSTDAGNRILSNSIFSNGDLGIDLGTDGVTPNDIDDPDTGANNLQNYPILTSALFGSTRVIGRFNSLPNTTFRLEFFNSPTADGEGQTFVGAFDITTNAGGNAAFDQIFATTSPLNSFVTATATNLTTGDTSEFSVAKQVLLPSAATVSISGQVVTSAGRGISKARITLTFSDGTTRSALTNSFGYYRFTDVPAGQTVVASISAKWYEFTPDTIVLQVSEDIQNMNWTSSE